MRCGNERLSNKVIKVIISLSFLSGTEARCTARRLFNQSWSQERQVVKRSWCRSRPAAQQQQYCGSSSSSSSNTKQPDSRETVLIALCWYKYRHCVTRWDSSSSLGSGPPGPRPDHRKGAWVALYYMVGYCTHCVIFYL